MASEAAGPFGDPAAALHRRRLRAEDGGPLREPRHGEHEENEEKPLHEEKSAWECLPHPTRRFEIIPCGIA
jgi:hypothetical protein